jgi:hypothetical protein
MREKYSKFIALEKRIEEEISAAKFRETVYIGSENAPAGGSRNSPNLLMRPREH